jgi:hypothetical protein
MWCDAEMKMGMLMEDDGRERDEASECLTDRPMLTFVLSYQLGGRKLFGSKMLRWQVPRTLEALASRRVNLVESIDIASGVYAACVPIQKPLGNIVVDQACGSTRSCTILKADCAW